MESMQITLIINSWMKNLKTMNQLKGVSMSTEWQKNKFAVKAERVNVYTSDDDSSLKPGTISLSEARKVVSEKTAYVINEWSIALI
jgi:hypothetical protein